MPDRDTLARLLERTERYLTERLLPFWMERSPDPEFGGYLTYFDRDGRPTGETTKTFLMQIRMLYTFSSAHRAGYGGGRRLPGCGGRRLFGCRGGPFHRLVIEYQDIGGDVRVRGQGHRLLFRWGASAGSVEPLRVLASASSSFSQ